MHGYVAQRRDRFYAVLYEGIDPITGRERRRWHPTGTDRAEAEQLATRLAANCRGDDCGHRAGPTLGVYLTQKWLPTKQLTLRPSTWDGYRRNVELHVLPELGRVPIRHFAQNTSNVSTPNCSTTVAQTVAADWTARRCTRSTWCYAAPSPMPSDAESSRATRPRSRTHPNADHSHVPNNARGTPNNSRTFSTSQPAIASSQRSGSPRTPACDAANSSACVGATSTSTRSVYPSTATLISVGYELHESRGKTRTARRAIDLDEHTIAILMAISTNHEHDGYVFCHIDGTPIHPHVVSDTFKKLVARSGLPRIRFHDLRHTHATLLLKAGVPIKVVSERLGHTTPGFTMATYQHVLPGMQQEAARTFAAILEPSTGSTRWNTR